MFDSQIGKVKFGQRLKDGSKQAGVSVSFVITYNLKRSPLHQDESFKQIFSPAPMFSYNSARKLSGYLVRGKL